MYKEDLALNNQQWLICHEPKPNQTKHILFNSQPSTTILAIFNTNRIIKYNKENEIAYAKRLSYL